MPEVQPERPAPGPTTAAILERAAAHGPGLWSPDVVFVRGEGARLWDAVEHPRLLVQRGLRRVEVLRWVEVAVVERVEHPSSEAHDVPAGIVDREHQPAPEPVA